MQACSETAVYISLERISILWYAVPPGKGCFAFLDQCNIMSTPGTKIGLLHFCVQAQQKRWSLHVSLTEFCYFPQKVNDHLSVNIPTIMNYEFEYLSCIIALFSRLINF